MDFEVSDVIDESVMSVSKVAKVKYFFVLIFLCFGLACFQNSSCKHISNRVILHHCEILLSYEGLKICSRDLILVLRGIKTLISFLLRFFRFAISYSHCVIVVDNLCPPRSRKQQ